MAIDNGPPRSPPDPNKDRTNGKGSENRWEEAGPRPATPTLGEIRSLIEEIGRAASTHPDASPDLRPFTARDSTLLLRHGFKYSFSGSGMEGYDLLGREWYVWLESPDAGQGGACWYKVRSSGVKEKVGVLSYEDVVRLLNQPKPFELG